MYVQQDRTTCDNAKTICERGGVWQPQGQACDISCRPSPTPRGAFHQFKGTPHDNQHTTAFNRRSKCNYPFHITPRGALSSIPTLPSTTPKRHPTPRKTASSAQAMRYSSRVVGEPPVPETSPPDLILIHPARHPKLHRHFRASCTKDACAVLELQTTIGSMRDASFDMPCLTCAWALASLKKS